MIRKAIFMMALCLCGQMQVNAATTDDGTIEMVSSGINEDMLRQIEPTYIKEVAVPSAWSSNWFVGVSGGTSAFVGKPHGKGNLFDRMKPSLAIKAGKWFTPEIGGRFCFQGFQFKDASKNVFVQSNINAFGKMAMAGCGSYSKIEGFAFLPVTCFTMALTTFVSQNLGAKQYDRAKKGARFGVLCSITIAELIGIIIYVAAPVLITAFNRDPDVVHYGVMQSRTIALFYCLLAFSHCIAAILRGSGNASVPMIVMLCDWCLFRVSYITVAVRILPDIRVIFWAYPLTWGISSVIFLYLFLRGKWVYGFEKS